MRAQRDATEARMRRKAPQRTAIWFFRDFPRPTQEDDFQSEAFLQEVMDWIMENGSLLTIES